MQGKRPDSDKLIYALNSILGTLDKDVYIVLDGIDEYPLDTDMTKRKELLCVINSVVEEGHENIHFLVVGREEPDISKHLTSNDSGLFEQLNVESGIIDDIELYITKRMTEVRLHSLNEKLKEAIKKRLMKNEAGEDDKIP